MGSNSHLVNPVAQLTPERIPKDSHLRSFVKALSWRVLATLTTAVIAYVVTGEVQAALLIGGVEFFLKFLIYYCHERIWQRIPLGRTKIQA